ncbi:hypothetical protein ACQ4LE_005480 [Meloidogyne hapla]|uniref:Uncharacterized protein n=1 Tax=Meloidogyne hapla TaxID=6305 RepID=A0A1I8BAN0_MELHA
MISNIDFISIDWNGPNLKEEPKFKEKRRINENGELCNTQECIIENINNPKIRFLLIIWECEYRQEKTRFQIKRIIIKHKDNKYILPNEIPYNQNEDKSKCLIQ